MGPLLNDWILSRMMSAPKKDDSIIYKLQNHVCDGTAATCINTGLHILGRAFVQSHPKFQIEISFVADSTNAPKAHVIRCCRVDGGYEGFYIRVYDIVGTYRIRISGLNGVAVYDRRTPNDLLTIRDLIISFDFVNSIFRVINRNQNGSDESVRLSLNHSIFDNTPFVIGGSVINGVDASGGWKETWKGTINSLIIRDIR